MTDKNKLETPQGDGNALHAAYASAAEIDIDAPAEVVWPHVLNMASWVEDFHFELASGKANSEGQIQYLWPTEIKGIGGVMKVSAKERTLATGAAWKTLKIISERLWYAVTLPRLQSSQRMFTTEGRIDNGELDVRSTGGFLIWLTEVNGKTRITALRTQESQCPTEQVAQMVQEGMAKYQPLAQARWTERYLPRLKALAEADARLSMQENCTP